MSLCLSQLNETRDSALRSRRITGTGVAGERERERERERETDRQTDTDRGF